MFSFDLSKSVPQKALTHLTLLIPGCFFEVSILLANPQLFANYVKDLHQAIPVSPYLLLSIALFVGFIIGSAAVVFVALLQPILNRIYAIRYSLALAIFAKSLKAITRRTPSVTVPTSGGVGIDDAQRAMRAWRRLSAKLLHDRYGVEPRHLKTDWVFYMTALSDLTHEEVQGPLMISIFHATGWCGLVATFPAPALRTAYYLGPCLILIAYGLFASYGVARNMKNRLNIVLLGMRAVVREYEKDRLAVSTTSKPLDRSKETKP
jgi:hypothetical protein